MLVWQYWLPPKEGLLTIKDFIKYFLSQLLDNSYKSATALIIP
jgi:hypothetical protein